LEKQERLDEARPLYERALAIEPAFPRLATNLARIYSLRGETARAKGLLERSAKNIDPQDLAMALALYEADAGETDRALARLRAAVASHADWKLARSSLAHLLLATAHWREGWTEYVRRFAPLLHRSGARLVLACERKLHPVVQRNAILDEVRDGDAVTGFDRAV